jgi:hypothetical protein
MAKGVTQRSAWQDVAKKHAAYSKQHPEWMGRAIEALKPWGEQGMTLQHAVAVALQAMYEAGTRGEYPKPIDHFDRYREQDREDDDGRSSGVRIMRRGNVPARNGADQETPGDEAEDEGRDRDAPAGHNGVGHGHVLVRSRGSKPAPKVIRRRS